MGDGAKIAHRDLASPLTNRPAIVRMHETGREGNHYPQLCVSVGRKDGQYSCFVTIRSYSAHPTSLFMPETAEKAANNSPKPHNIYEKHKTHAEFFAAHQAAPF